MKTLILLLLFFCNSIQAQHSNTNSTSENKIDYLKSHFSELEDRDGKNITVTQNLDSIVFTGEANNNYMGCSVSSAGDVNGDGYADIIVGAMGYAGNKGRAYIYYGGNLMDNIADVVFTGDAAEYYMGISVSTAGDVNNDGFSDVIVGADGFNNFTGKVYIFYGGLSMNNVADVILTGENEHHSFGFSVSTAGDVNGDGFSDVIVGGPDAKKAYVYYGGTSMNDVVDLYLSGELKYNYFGWAVSTAGDVNNDGYSDIVVGAPGGNGRAYVFYGSLSMDNIADVTMTGENADNHFGISVSSAGNVNGDLYSDIIVGARGFNSFTGRAYIFHGSQNMDNIADVTMTGENSNDYFGRDVSTAGDLNGDSYSEVIVSAYYFNSHSGKVYIYEGGPLMDNVADYTMTGENGSTFGSSVSSAGDVNNDGNQDLIIGAESFNLTVGRSYLYRNFVHQVSLYNPANNSVNNPLSINFKWSKLNNASFYNLLVSSDSLFSNIIVNDTIFVDTAITKNGFAKDSKYFWKIIATDTSGISKKSIIWNFKTIPPLKLNLKVLTEGMYYPLFNLMSRRDTVKIYLHQTTSPYIIVDSSKSVLDSLTFRGLFKFYNAVPGTYFLAFKHFNSIETWSKSGGVPLTIADTAFYDFTTSISQAYGNNLKLKGGKYCIFGGNVNGDAIVDGSDLSEADNDSFTGLTGRFLRSDVNGDNIVDAADVSLVDNNSYNSILRIIP